MAGLIQATPDQLEGNGRTFVAKSEDIERVLGELNAVKAELEETWKGSSSEAFVGQYEELYPKMVDFKELIHDVGKQLQSVAAALREADDNIAGQIRG